MHSINLSITRLRVIGRYAQRLKECQGKLVRVSVSEPVCHQLEKTDLLAWLAKDHVTGA